MGSDRVTAYAHADAPGCMAVTALTQLAARVVHGCVLDHVRVASSASLRLTAKPHDTRDPQGMTLTPISVLSCTDAASHDQPTN